MTREEVCKVARSYLRTPYHDCAAVKHHGVDCATLLAMVYEEAGVIERVPMPKYSPQWYLHRDAEVYLKNVCEHTVEILEPAVLPGDVVLYKFGRCYAHGGIVVEPGWPSIIHAYKQHKMVVLGEGLGGDLAQRPRRFFSPKAWRL